MSEWVIAERNPDDRQPLESIRLFAVVGTWMESDIIVATVRNAMTQGCERVYLVDNGSTDDTVALAVAEGATHARSFRTERYDEGLRVDHMNAVVAEVSASEPDDHIWWLFLDADEFPHGPFGLTLLDYLRTLDRRFRVVGMRFLDHYPSSAPAYVNPFHPLDYQPLCVELALPMCGRLHRKHSLLRCDRKGAPVTAGKGFHVASCYEPLIEPTQAAFIHHFPFRQPHVTARRLEALWTPDVSGRARALDVNDAHMLARYRSLDAAYAQDWASVHNFLALDPMDEDNIPAAMGISPAAWTELVEPMHHHVARWYDSALATDRDLRGDR